MARLRMLAAVGLAVAGTVAQAVDAAADEAVGDPLPAVTGTWDALAADFDRRNGPDIVLTRHQRSGGRFWGGLYLADGSGAWRLGLPFPRKDRHGCDSGDVDSDGRLDLYCEVGAVRGFGEGINELWLQQPDGSFIDQARAWGVTDGLGRGRRPLLYDHNGDGLLDLFMTNAERPDGTHPGNRLFINTGHASFRGRVTAATGNHGYRCVAHADLDGDGRQDLVVCSGSGTLHIYKNKGFGHRDVSFLTGGPVIRPRDVQLSDLDRDGLIDLVVVLRDRVEIRLNRGFGRRFAVVTKSVPLVAGGRALVGNMTRDRRLDVYVSDGCSPGGQNAPDKLLVGPRWHAVTPAGDAVGGCGNEVVDAGSLVVFNGTESTSGPVTVREGPIWTAGRGPPRAHVP